MMKPSIAKAMLFSSLLGFTCFINAQAGTKAENPPIVAAAKPFKVLTNGRQITIQSKQNLKSLMVWSASGHRIVEHKDINSTSYKFTIPQKEKVCFLMLVTTDGKRFTEKIGLQ